MVLLGPLTLLTPFSCTHMSRPQCDACDLALDVFKQMHEDKIRPNVVTYNTLVDVYGKTGQWEKAVRVLDDMRQEVRLLVLHGDMGVVGCCTTRRPCCGCNAVWTFCHSAGTS